ncbi:MAG: hypothetical protein AB1531_09445 [Chloroflexota bacterium]
MSLKLPALFLVCLLLVACKLPSGDNGLSFGLTEEPTVTESPVPYTGCYFNWATQPLPDLSLEVQAAMETAGLEGVTAIAEAYGENCYDSQTNEVVYFATLETDFRVTVEVDNLEDTVALGDMLELILVTLDQFPPGATSGPQPGYIGVNFIKGEETLYLWFTVIDGESARALGLHGADLLEELQNR